MNKTNKLSVISVSTYNGTKKRSGEPFTCYTAYVNIDGDIAGIKVYDTEPVAGDLIEVGLGIKNTIYGKEVAPIVIGVHHKEELKNV